MGKGPVGADPLDEWDHMSSSPFSLLPTLEEVPGLFIANTAGELMDSNTDNFSTHVSFLLM